MTHLKGKRPPMYIPGLAILLSIVFSVTLAAKPSNKNALSFHLTASENENYFYRDNITSAQLLLTSPSSNATRRLVAALPAGNSGALVYFLPAASNSGVISDKLDITLVNGTLKSATSPFHNAGIQANVHITANATLGVTIVGSVRAMRDYVEGSGTMHSIFNYTLLSHSVTEVRLHRKYINSTVIGAGQNDFKSVDLELSVPSNSDVRFHVVPSSNQSMAGPPPRIDIIVPSISQPKNGAKSVFSIKVLTNETSLPGLSPPELFLSPDSDAAGNNTALRNVLEGLQDDSSFAVNQVSFLSFQEKFTAGGWRFLTYFGRDTMIALRLLMPLMTPSAVESVLGAVIERANSTGALCHEETIGDYASFVNINNNQSELGNTPFYDYKMIDTDLYLLPTLAHYLLDLPQGGGRAQPFLSKNASLQNGTYKDIVNRVAAYTTNRAIPFSITPNASNLLSFRPGQPVGNWRDSNEGTGYGRTPFDVNVALVPANLRALDRLVAAGFVDGVSGAQDLAGIAKVWEENAESLFRVSIPGNVVDQRLEDFVQQVGLSSVLLNGTNRTDNVEFYALSLMDDGSPVEVLNSDLSFQLMYGTNVSTYFMERVVDVLTSYPRGLLTNIGMVVANPALDSNRTNIHVLDRTSYHGTVVWSFQQALMAAGLARQLSLCFNNASVIDVSPVDLEKPEWCGNSDLIEQLQDAQGRLWRSIDGAPDERFTEVWSYAFDNATQEFQVADLAGLSPTGTESDAIQLWSYGFLGLIDPTNAMMQ